MGIKKIGHWDKVRKLVYSIQDDLEQAQKIALSRWGLLAERISVKHISSQDLNWKPLSPKTISKKMRKGYSEKILVQSSTYFQSITSFVKDDTAYAGVLKEVSYAKGGEIANIAAVLEFGSVTKNIPARPLWKPTLDEVIEKIKSDDNLNPVKIFIKTKSNI